MQDIHFREALPGRTLWSSQGDEEEGRAFGRWEAWVWLPSATETRISAQAVPGRRGRDRQSNWDSAVQQVISEETEAQPESLGDRVEEQGYWLILVPLRWCCSQ